MAYSFQGERGQRIEFRDRGSTADAGLWRLYGPEGQTADIGGPWQLGRSFGLVLPRSGRYLLLLSGYSSSDPIAYAIQAITPTATTKAYVLGQTETFTLGPGERRSFTFAGTAGQPIYYDDLNLYAPNVTLTAPDGSQVLSGVGDRGPLLLPATGEYVLTTQDDSFGEVATLGFRILEVLHSPSLTIDGAAISGAVGLEAKLFSFPGTSGQRVDFRDTSGADAATINRWLYAPDGQAIPISQYLGESFGTTLPQTGDYLLVLSGQPADPVPYAIQTVTPAVTAANYALGQIVDFELGRGERRKFTFVGSAWQRLYYSLSKNESDAAVSVRDSSGNDVVKSLVVNLLVLPAAGTYTLIADDEYFRGPGRFSFRLADLAQPPLPSMVPRL